MSLVEVMLLLLPLEFSGIDIFSSDAAVLNTLRTSVLGGESSFFKCILKIK